MKKTMIITSVRPKLMFRFLQSFKEQKMQEKGWDIALMAQCYNGEELEQLTQQDLINSSQLVKVDSLTAPYIAKNRLIELYPADVYCSLDDDCVLLKETNYEPVVEFVRQPLVGLVSCNWVRFNKPSFMEKKTIADSYIKQKIVYTGGGMLFDGKVREVLINKPQKDWLFDNVQYSVDVYTAGLINYRYLGSVAEHNIIVGGGKKRLLNERQMVLNDPSFVDLKKSPKRKYKYENEYFMPDERSLTALSHAMHKKHYQQRINE